jgi:hypothetical protein
MVAHQRGESVEVVIEIGQPLPRLGYEHQMLRTRVGQQYWIVGIEIIGRPSKCLQYG